MVGKAARYLANNALGALALFVALGGVSYAASGGFVSGGQLKACVNEGGSITLLKSGKHCKRGQKPIAWSQQGPAGPQGQPGANGAPGATGATGLTGPAGTNGLNGQPSNVMWAKIGEEGTIEEGHGVIGVKDSGLAPYRVKFEKDVTNCAVVATNNGGFPSQNAPAATSDAVLGSEVIVWILGPKGEGDNVAAPFSIIAVC
jgi:hypothetical protein